MNQNPTDHTYIFLWIRCKFGKIFSSCFPSLLFASYCREILESRKCIFLVETKLKGALQTTTSDQTRAISRPLCAVLGPQQLISFHRMAPIPLCSLLHVDVWKACFWHALLAQAEQLMSMYPQKIKSVWFELQ